MKHIIKKAIISCSGILILLACSGPQKSISTLNPKAETIFQEVVDSIYAANPDAVGIMVHVEAPDKNISWSGGVGYSDKEAKTVLEVDQPALIASNTKTYVSAAILRLVENGHITLDQPIGEVLTNETKTLFDEDGYDLSAITIQHLLSHTSGIFDYVNADAFFTTVLEHPKHRWTRDEQIKLAITDGSPLALAGEGFSYADTNFSLLSEIIENQVNKPFYKAMRELLDYSELGLSTTWFNTLEDKPQGAKSLVHQYATSTGIDSYTIDHSFDLYGGGGIAATTRDLARFAHAIFSDQLFENKETDDLMLTKAAPLEGDAGDYRLGISGFELNDVQAFGHGGFWGTVVAHIPSENATFAVFILEKDKGSLRKVVNEALLTKLQALE